MADLITTQQQLEEIIKATDGILKEYHEAKTEFENLDEQKKPTLAACEIKYLDCGTQTEITRKALNDSIYKLHVTALNNARADFNKAWARLKGLEIKLACLQSINKYLQ